MERNIKLKNISRANMSVILDSVKAGRHFDLKPDSFCIITSEELDYLRINCPRAFSEGFLEVCDPEVAKQHDIEKTVNAMTEDEIKELLDKNKKQFSAKINKITSAKLLKDIRVICDAEDKTKFIEVIDERLKEVTDGALLV